MSSTDDTASGDLKAGHPPAVKVGGMRVVKHKKESEKAEPVTMTPEEEAEYGSSPPKADKHHQSMVVSGAVTKKEGMFEGMNLVSNQPVTGTISIYSCDIC